MTNTALLACLSALERVGPITWPQQRSDNQQLVTFYRGTTYYDALRAESEGFDAGGNLSKRQSGRGMDPGLYTSRNVEVAKFFAYENSDSLTGFSGQGGPALMKITLSTKKFEEISAKYGVIDNRPITGIIPPSIPPPHVETLFPYAALPELFLNSNIEVEALPLE